MIVGILWAFLVVYGFLLYFVGNPKVVENYHKEVESRKPYNIAEVITVVLAVLINDPFYYGFMVLHLVASTSLYFYTRSKLS